ncbi:MAG TPA: hypothetical protein PKM78_18480 [Anaerolineae bacterium]|nr:hypothetical protein [Anaerolineae bacterium]
MPSVEMTTALAGCFATCTGYALLLCTKRGMWLSLNLTWLTVVIGVGLVLGWIATQPPHTALTDLYFFIAGGLPIVIRSWILTARHLWALALYEMRSNK